LFLFFFFPNFTSVFVQLCSLTKQSPEFMCTMHDLRTTTDYNIKCFLHLSAV